MKISDLKFEMELAGVDKAEIAEILQPYNHKTIDLTLIDDELEKRGFARIFDINYNLYDDEEDDDWDDDYQTIEKFPHKNRYDS